MRKNTNHLNLCWDVSSRNEFGAGAGVVLPSNPNNPPISSLIRKSHISAASESSLQMGACDWFKRSNKKKKEMYTPKQPKSSTCFSIFGFARNGRRLPNKDMAATRIQTAFRAYMARKALHRLKGKLRFQGMIEAQDVTKQVLATLDHIHVWSKIQAQIRARRIFMVTQGRMRQKKLQNQLKAEAKLHELEVEWSGGSETMEEIISRIQQKEEATVKRERAMAYAFSHQWRAKTNGYFGQAYYDLGKETWGWSWMERWIAVCPWETRVLTQPVVPKKQVHPTRHGSKAADKPTKQAAAAATTEILVSVKKNQLGTKKATVLPASASASGCSNSKNKD